MGLDTSKFCYNIKHNFWLASEPSSCSCKYSNPTITLATFNFPKVLELTYIQRLNTGVVRQDETFNDLPRSWTVAVIVTGHIQRLQDISEV